MPPPSRRKQQSREANEKSIEARKNSQEKNAPKEVDPKHWTASVIVNGDSYTRARNLFQDNNIKVPSEKEFYRHQKEIGKVILEYKEQSIKNAQQTMKKDTFLSTDLHYNVGRNATACQSLMMDNRGKVVGETTVIKKSSGGDFEGPSNMMETECTKRMMSNFDFTNVSTVVHDNDNKTKAIIQQYAPNAKITLDPRHCVRAVGRAFEKLENGGYKEAAEKETVNQQKESESQPAFPIKSKAEEPKKRGRPLKHQEKVFHQIYSKVIKWFTFIIMLPIETTKKIFLWKNTLNHFIGRHENCLHEKDKEYPVFQPLTKPDLAKQFQRFTDDAAKLIPEIDPNAQTQQNESIHHSMLTQCPKGNNAKSFEMRTAVTILQKNEGETCKQEIYNRVNNYQISPSIRELQKLEYEKNKSRNQKKASPEPGKEINKARNAKRFLKDNLTGDTEGGKWTPQDI
ncbi:hypothetical protein TVAG_393070 [Trichomonas vaginalis G3]|uniref:Transposase IS204/IS1001/IS1096/IS1165 DDE domain-containing protein n=1 Tax=Trichomonas vaginalis (strain ATCC PRA-98 / G3) TaxID=412133 RepID=A2DYA3_TRIV3|nr:hypothetical protein TVAG_393070 [Trichomonas vaginalis G3]|eukprot:XP_001326803.1 hypothetical protein [Trichomonas vaginalis G3]